MITTQEPKTTATLDLQDLITRFCARRDLAARTRDYYGNIRHYFATHYREAGGDINSLRLLLSHATLDMVLKYAKFTNVQKALAQHWFGGRETAGPGGIHGQEVSMAIIHGKELGYFLQEESRRRGISMRRLSINSGLSPAAVHGIFRTGRANLTSLNKLADYLGVNRQYLWQLAGLLESTETGFTDARLRSQFARVDRLPDSARTLVSGVIEMVITYVEDGLK